MKIGILTFHRADNFGAVLQAYALQKYLTILSDDEVDIIDYRCRSIESVYKPFMFRNYFRKEIWKGARALFADMLVAKDIISRHKKYEDFRKHYFKLSTPVYNINDIALLSYDLIVTGSDQVWNEELTNDDNIYFIPIDGVRKISYAVSMEHRSLEKICDNKERYKVLLNSYSAISVREKLIADKLNIIGINNVETTCDPTFLFDEKVYRELIKELRPAFRRKYLLVYNLQYSIELDELADHLAKQTGLSIINVYVSFEQGRNNVTEVQNYGPLELLSLINCAEYVLTTSFHGVAFSLILEKQFYAVKTTCTSRIENVLRYMNLEDRLVGKTFPNVLRNIDYPRVKKCKELYVKNSIDFIKTNIV